MAEQAKWECGGSTARVVAVFVALYFVIVERRSRRPAVPIAFAIGAWLFSGVVGMPLVGLLQGAPPAGSTPSDPMTANLFMLNLGPGAAAESFLGWLLFGVVLLAGLTPTVSARALTLAVAAAVLAAAIALLAPTLIARADAGRVVEGRLAALPA